MTVHRLSVVLGASLALATAIGCRAPTTRTTTECDNSQLAGFAAAVRAATEHRQRPYASPHLTDRWRERQQLCAVAQQAKQLMAERDRQRETELAAAPEERRPEIERAAQQVQASLAQVKVAAEAGDRPAVRCNYRAFACACAELAQIRSVEVK
jgi:hypothetical protein